MFRVLDILTLKKVFAVYLKFRVCQRSCIFSGNSEHLGPKAVGLPPWNSLELPLEEAEPLGGCLGAWQAGWGCGTTTPSPRYWERRME